MQGGAVAGQAEIQHGGDREGDHAHRGAERGAMQALIKAVEAPEPQAADQGQQPAEHEQRGNQEVRPQGEHEFRRHSMTSPRSRNLASAIELTKPSRAMVTAASKNSVLSKRMPSTSSMSMAQIYMVSSAKTRSWAAGPLMRRIAASTIAKAMHSIANRLAQPSTFVIRKSPSRGARTGS